MLIIRFMKPLLLIPVPKSAKTHRLGATQGAKCKIVGGVTIGEYALIGAGAEISKNARPYDSTVGVPARQFG